MIALVGGIVVLAVTFSGVFTTVVVPRASSAHLLRGISKGYGVAVKLLARLFPSYKSKDRLLALVGPLGLVSQLLAWLCLLVVGFALVTWWASGSSISHSFAVSGSSVFAIGVVTEHRLGPEWVEFVAAAAGLLVIAMTIAYLPTLYAAFSAREAEVSLLAPRAGVPAWGPEMLARAHRFSLMGSLPGIYSTWERWAAAIAENHTNYPSLIWFRSPQPLRSWLTSLVATMDAAALQDALTPQAAPLQARVFLQVGTHCLRSLASVLRIPYDPDPLPTSAVRLTYEEYMTGIERLERAGFHFERTPEEAWRHFRGWRINYEAIVDELTAVVVPPPTPWFVRRDWLGEVELPNIVDRTPDDVEGTGSSR